MVQHRAAQTGDRSEWHEQHIKYYAGAHFAGIKVVTLTALGIIFTATKVAASVAEAPCVTLPNPSSGLRETIVGPAAVPAVVSDIVCERAGSRPPASSYSASTGEGEALLLCTHSTAVRLNRRSSANNRNQRALISSERAPTRRLLVGITQD